MASSNSFFRVTLNPQFMLSISRLPDQLKDKIRRAILKSGKLVWRDAVAKAPIGRYKGGGFLKRSIKYIVTNDGMSVEIGISNKDAFYGRFIEFGTKKARAKPFLLPAFRQNKRENRQRIARAIKSAFRAMAKR